MPLNPRHVSPTTAAETKLRDELEAVLRKDNHVAICVSDEGKTAGNTARRAVVAMTETALIWCALVPAFVAATLLDAPMWAYAVGGVVTLALLAALVVGRDDASAWRFHIREERVTALAKPLLWITGLSIGWEIGSGDYETLGVTHGVSLGAAGAIALAVVAVRRLGSLPRAGLPHLERGMALVIPVGVLVLFWPLFGAEVWAVADELTFMPGALLAPLTIGPLYVFVYRQLRESIPAAFSENAKRMSGELAERGSTEPAQMVYDLVGGRRQVGENDTLDELIGHAFHPATVGARGRAIGDVMSREFRTPLLVGLIPVVLSILLVMSLFMYFLAAIVIDVDLAEHWIRESGAAAANIETSPILGLPGSPYPVVALIMGLVATGVFLASALTQEEFKKLLAESAVHEPVRKCLRAALPYRLLVKKHDHRRFALLLEGEAARHPDDNAYATASKEEDGAHLDGAKGRTLWYRWRAPSEQQYAFTVEGGFAPVVAIYPAEGSQPVPCTRVRGGVRFDAQTGEEYHVAVDACEKRGAKPGPFTLVWAPAPPPANERFATATPIAAVSGSVTGSTQYARREKGEPNHAGLRGNGSVWYRWTAPGDGWVNFEAIAHFKAVVDVHQGAAVDELTRVEDQRGDAGRVSFCARKDETYHVAVDGLDDEAGPFELRWATVPPNETFARAEVITGMSGEARGDTTLATSEAGEPWHAMHPGGRSVWFTWTAPEDGPVTFGTHGSTFDTLLAAYCGDALDRLELVAANDDDPHPEGGSASRVEFVAVKGTEYRIALDGYFGAHGPYVLAWAPAPTPANDLFANAEPIAGAEGITRGDNRFAHRELGEPEHAGNGGGRSLWYRWTPPADGYVEFETAGSNFDTLLAAYTGDSVDDLTLVAENDDDGNELTSRIEFYGREGESYAIAVDGYTGSSGDAVLSWRPLAVRAATRHRVEAGAARLRRRLHS